MFGEVIVLISWGVLLGFLLLLIDGGRRRIFGRKPRKPFR